MSHKAYTFDFLKTISLQLREELDALDVTPLTEPALQELRQYQRETNAEQGVYVIYLEDRPVYLGKADSVSDRLSIHRKKISGRMNLDASVCGYKALLLDKSMSTAANEDLLIAMFRASHSGLWNGTGFGPKDPGKNRDTGKPSEFDRAYPINQAWPLDFSSLLSGTSAVAEVLLLMKKQLPYLFRYEIDAIAGETPVNVNDLPVTAREALHAVVRVLGAGWKGVVLAHGMILYKTNANYPYGTVLEP